MKKSLIALAALATVATVAQAQSSVTVYGVLDAGIRVNEHAAATSTVGSTDRNTVFTSGALTTPRIGFKGTEDLGGGLKAGFNLETGVSTASGAQSQPSYIFDRLAFVSVGNKDIDLQLGRNLQAGVIYAIQGITDPLSQQGDGIATTVTGNQVSATVSGTGTSGTAGRINQAITIVGATNSYGTTRSNGMIKAVGNLGDLNVQFGYAPGGTGGDATANSSYNYGLSYGIGNAKVAASYFEAKDAARKSLNYTSVGANYKLNDLTFVAGYHQMNVDAAYAKTNLSTDATAATPVISALTTDSKSKVQNYGVKYAINPKLTSTLAYYKGTYSNATQEGKLETYVLLTVYDLSKRTNIYAHLDYQSASGAITSTSTSTIRANSSTGLAVGVRHSF